MLIKKSKKLLIIILSMLAIISMGVFACYRVPELQMKASQALTWFRVALNPVEALPTADVISKQEPIFWTPDLVSVAANFTGGANNVISKQVALNIPTAMTLATITFNPQRDYQDWNNCGPATLALGLRYWGWQGDQFTISEAIRPERQDKNVNIEELAAYVNGSVEGLQAEVRVGGDLTLLEALIAAGYPVIIEESFKLEKSAWPGDDLWAGHYILLTGYDKQSQHFIAQDSYHGPDRQLTYADVSDAWEAFNHVYLVIFPTGDLQKVQQLLAEDWPVEANYEWTAAALRDQVLTEPANAYAWFNLGSSLNALQQYEDALLAFDNARALGLPSRMLRYQFGPLSAAYHTGDAKDLTRLADYALHITPDSEEALLWKGWAYELAGDHLSAINLFNLALQANPGNDVAKKALETVRP
jgi:tetratricopeptide (TPR) repeat protein